MLSLSHHTLAGRSVYDHVYTSSVEFNINNRLCSVRFGPLAYITSDVSLASHDDTDRRRSLCGPMQHKMIGGSYRIHRVKKTSPDDDTEAQFTVITLHQLDPLKIVLGLRGVTCISRRALKTDSYFDNRRWMQFAGKTNLPAAVIRSRPEDSRNRLRRQVALAAYTCCLYRSSDSGGRVDPLMKKEMLKSDVDTFYIRILAKQLIGDLRIELSSQGAGEFSVTAANSRSPAIIGVSQVDRRLDYCGYVLYTRTDLIGNTLPRKRAFAVVLGPAVQTRRTDGRSVTFDDSFWCSDFLYDEEDDCVGKEVSDSESPSSPQLASDSRGREDDDDDAFLRRLMCYDVLNDSNDEQLKDDDEEGEPIRELLAFRMGNKRKMTQGNAAEVDFTKRFCFGDPFTLMDFPPTEETRPSTPVSVGDITTTAAAAALDRETFTSPNAREIVSQEWSFLEDEIVSEREQLLEDLMSIIDRCTPDRDAATAEHVVDSDYTTDVFPDWLSGSETSFDGPPVELSEVSNIDFL